MSNLDIKNMISDYCNWLKDEITFSKFGEYYEITAPYLDRHNDYLQIYLKQEANGTITMTDDGYIIRDLLSCGFNLTPKRKKVVEHILNGVNMKLIDNSIIATANMNNLPQTKHLLFQTMLKIDDMFVLNRSNIENFFFEDVEEYFAKLEVYPTANFSILGKSGNYHNYDFHFQRTKNKPERFCKTIDKLKREKRDLTLFSWIDTQDKRKDDSNLIIIINDDNEINEKDLKAFQEYQEEYNIKPILFSRRFEKSTKDLFAS